MKFPAVVILFLHSLCALQAQKIQTIVPSQPVLAGNAFQVQYIITDPAGLLSIRDPVFDSLRLVSGPHYYKGTSMVDGKPQPIENITYTLVAAKAGNVKINGIHAVYRNAAEQVSDDKWISVSTPQKASFTSRSSYTDVNLYMPSSQLDLQQLVKENLFVKTNVSRKKCFRGEPLVATFILYSRLQSTSEVINSPSLYGFSVMDLVDINEAHLSVDTIDGKIFNTSILRQLLLYPAESGNLVIDPMQLKNEIEFDDSAKTRNNMRVQNQLASPSITVSVQPLPANAPENYTGAVGHFTISARMSDTVMVTGKQGSLVIGIYGNGNFIQFAPPAVEWPEAFDVFEPRVTDHITNSTSGAQGKREYEFHFTIERPGEFSIPPVSFSFFDPVSGKYKTGITQPISVKVKQGISLFIPEPGIRSASRSFPWVTAIVLLVFVILLLVWYAKKSKKIPGPVQSMTDYSQVLAAMDTTLLTGPQVCTSINKILSAAERDFPGITPDDWKEMKFIRAECELLAYSSVYSEDKKEQLKNRTLRLLEKINAGHSAYL